MKYEKQIREYQEELRRLKSIGGTTEGNLRTAFETLLKNIGVIYKLTLLAESREKVTKGNKNHEIRYDGALKRNGNSITNFGIWEAKDSKDDLYKEVEIKKNAGYEFFNFIIENTVDFILYQDGKEKLKGSNSNLEELDNCLELFFEYNNEDEEKFLKEFEIFIKQIQEIATDLKKQILTIEKSDQKFQEEVQNTLCMFSSINSSISKTDIHDIIIQHAITIRLFITIFGKDDGSFINRHEIVKQIDSIIENCLPTKRYEIDNKLKDFLKSLKKAMDSDLVDKNHKQDVLIAVYERFYKAYNPKKADKQGIVYTPKIIVDFMIKSSDYLMKEYFGKHIYDEGVKILDPSTGTGTFITSIIDYMGDPKLVQNKFNDIFAIEVDIMAYYMALLNIEDSYENITNEKIIFKNIALADTLEIPTIDPKTKEEFPFIPVYAEITKNNAELVAKIQKSDYLLIIGNPPYNANQKNENENNKNKRYNFVDKRVKDTYTLKSNAQKVKHTDMYVRFFRWASDKAIEKHNTEKTESPNNEGKNRVNQNGSMISFITNRSYLDQCDNGIRKSLLEEWDYIYVIDLGGTIRGGSKNKEKNKGNVFDIQTGVAISFLIKDPNRKKADNNTKTDAEIYYAKVDDYISGGEKLKWLFDCSDVYSMKQSKKFERIIPDKKGNWINDSEKDFDTYYSLAEIVEIDRGKESKKSNKANQEEKHIFKLDALGVSTNKDKWVYDFDKKNLDKKITIFIDKYEEKRKQFWNLSDKERNKILEIDKSGKIHQDQKKLQDWLGTNIKWSDTQRKSFLKNKSIAFDNSKIIESLYRPFVKKFYYADHDISDRYTKNHDLIFGVNGKLENIVIGYSGMNKESINCLISNSIFDLHFLGDTRCFARYTYSPHTYNDILECKPIEYVNDSARNEQINNDCIFKYDNITDKSLEYFKTQYKNESITKDDIFYYIYSVLNYEEYKERYKYNLKCQLPRIPAFGDLKVFNNLVELGRDLAKLHLDWEKIEPYKLNKVTSNRNVQKKYSLEFEGNLIKISNFLTLEGIPNECKKYTIDGRSAIDWVLECYKESKNISKEHSKDKENRDNSVLEFYHTGELEYYNLENFENELISILEKVVSVSLETLKIVKEINEVRLL